MDAIVDVGEGIGANSALDGVWAYYSTALADSLRIQGGMPRSLVSKAGVNYDLSSFKDKNALEIGDNGTKSGVLTFHTPVKTTQLWFLGITASGKKPVTVVVHYSDGTSSDSMAVTFSDWYQSTGYSAAYYGLSRMRVNAGYAIGSIDSRYQFCLFDRVIATDSSKTITSVSLSTIVGTYATIFGISAFDLARVQPKDKTLCFLSNAHLDTQWNWTVKTTIDEYIPNTFNNNFALFEKYPDYHFNFEGAIKYMWIKEYYPDAYTKLKEYVKDGHWSISGGSVDANDVMIPSAESIIRNFLYGQTFYKKEFGRKGGTDIMLPDCFGFPYSLPTLGKHSGVTGFHSQKLSWGSAYSYDALPSLCRWKGVDGSEIYAMLKPGAYVNQDPYKKDMSYDADILNEIITNKSKHGVPATFRYVGTGDRGGSISDETAGWIETSEKSSGPVSIASISPDSAFNIIAKSHDNLPIVDHELPMKTHGTGCYTSQAILKYWNRKNELLADATEKSSVAADWLGGLAYQSEEIRNSWIRLLWHQFHDDLTGTAMPEAYSITYNDQILTQLNLSKTLTNAVGAVARNLSTKNATGIPIVVYNSLSIERKDIVEGSVAADFEPSSIKILDKDGISVPVQKTGYKDGKLSFIFLATVPSLGFATFDAHLNETSAANLSSKLSVTSNSLENETYIVTVNANGDISSILDKKRGNKELLLSPIRMVMLNDESYTWPAWEISYDQINKTPLGYVDENVKVSIAENGPLRAALKITRTKSGSEFVQYIKLSSQGAADRIDIANEINWQTKNCLLKAVFPLTATNTNATYDLSIGSVQRPTNTSGLYEVAGHQWADLTNSDDAYGISILNDCKYGWDKPDTKTLRLSLIHSPKVNTRYTYDANQDLGLNSFIYSIYSHTGKWNEQTQWESQKLNQPLQAFQMPKQEGALGGSFEFAKLNTDKVAIKALKKAEDSDNLIVRVYELTGNAQDHVEITFPANIVSAKEVNGIEEEVGAATFSGNKLTMNLTKFQPKSFAIKLESPSIALHGPSSTAVTLPYNIDVMSCDTMKTDGNFGESGSTYPSELISDQVLSDGISFTMGCRADGKKNAIRCRGQVINLPQGVNASKLYILAASQKVNGSVADFIVDGVAKSQKVGYFADFVGQWGTIYNSRFYNQENCALTLTHRHDVNTDANLSYQYLYMFKYVIPVTANAQTLTLPNNPDIIIFAASLSDNKNDDVVPVTAVSSLPVFKDIVTNEEETPCGDKLIPTTTKASGYNNEIQMPQMAADNNPFTKWCDITSSSKWLEYDFSNNVQICQWDILHAGLESDAMITSNFTLQYAIGNLWVNADVVTGNTEMKTSRLVTPFQTKKVRLNIIKGEQSGSTARIYSFDLYGKTLTTGLENLSDVHNGLTYNYPNPFDKSTVISCNTPDNASEIVLIVYNVMGTAMDKVVYPLSNGGKQELTWQNKSCKDGIYFYKLTIRGNGKIFQNNNGKMIISNNAY